MSRSKNVVIAVALIAAGFFAAWLRFRPHLGHEGVLTDGARRYGELSEERLRYAVWDRPLPLPAGVNSAGTEARPALSPDGRLLVFAAGEPGLSADLWVCEVFADGYGEPRALVELNSTDDELAPAFARGALWFASDREGSLGGLDLWRAPYADGLFGTPEHLGAGLNTRADDTDPAPAPVGQAVAFASNRERERHAGHDLFLARPHPSEDWVAERLDTLASPDEEREPAWTADGRALVFASDRAGGAGGFDLWRSVNDRGRWLPPERLDGVNTPRDERGPHPTADGFRLYFSTTSEDGDADLWSARSIELYRTRGKPVGWLELVVLAALLLLALLAWLAKKWDSLEVLYRCVLISLVAHLLLLWWFRSVHPESEPVLLAAGDELFHVRLATSPSAELAGARERAGALEAERAQDSSGAAAPERAVAGAAELRPAAAPARPLARGSAAESASPGPRPFEHREQSATPVSLADSVDSPTESHPRRTGAAPEVALAAGATRVAREEAAVAAPSFDVALAAVTGARSPSPSAPAGAAIDRAAATDATLPGARTVEARPLAAAVPTAVVARPAAPEARRGENAPALTVAASAVTRASSRSAPAGPARERADSAPRAAPLEPGPAASAPLAAAPVPTAAASEPERRELSISPGALPDVASTSVALRDAEESGPVAARSEETPALVAEALRFSSAGVRAGDPGSGPARATPRDTSAPPALLAGASALLSVAEAPAPRSPEARSPAATPIPRAVPSVALDAPSDPTRTAAAVSREEQGREIALEAVAIAPPSARAASAPTRHRPAEASAPARDSAPRPEFQPLDVGPAPAPEVASAPVASVWEHTPYQTRLGPAREQALEEHGGSVETEAAVAAGLAYLARRQRRDGHWGTTDDYDDKYGNSTIGKTGLSLLAFLGAGHTQDRECEYRDVVERAIGYLLSVQDEESGHFGFCSAYGHGIATYSLAECYALTDDPRLRAPLEHAVAHILAAQSTDRRDARRFGGWSYYYPDERTYDSWSRTSVTAWQVMALESARLGGLEVPDRAFADARTFLTNAWDPDGGWFRYNHDPTRLRSRWPTLPGSTPAGLFALSLLGVDAAAPQLARARRFVLSRAPESYEPGSQDEFVLRAVGNLYFWYYSTLALFRAGGDDWQRWNEALKETLLPAQANNGSWRPISVYAEMAGDTNGDRVYTTAMCVLTLEVYYRYFTPLLEVR